MTVPQSQTWMILILLSFVAVGVVALLGGKLWPKSTSHVAGTPEQSADSIGLASFLDQFTGDSGSTIHYEDIHPGQIQLTGAFDGCDDFGLVRLKLPDSRPVDICFVSAQEAIPQWKAIPIDTEVQFSGVLSSAVLYHTYQGASVLPTGFRFGTHDLKSGSGQLKGDYSEHRTKPPVSLFIDDVRPLSPQPLTDAALAEAFATHWAAHAGAALNRNAEGRVDMFSAIAVHRQQLAFDRPPWEQVSAHLSDDAIAILCQLPVLWNLTLRSERMTDKSMKSIGNVPSLKSLTLMYGTFTDAGVADLKNCSRLEQLSITGNTKITDTCIDVLQNLPALTDVNLSDTSVTEAGLARLKTAKNVDVSQTNKQPQSYVPKVSDPKKLRPLALYSEHRTTPGRICISADGSMFASAEMFNKEIHLWNLETRKRSQTLNGHTDWVYSLAFHPKLPLLISSA
ncbi:MAG: hypothetical protein KDA89_16810, partial [Planctomycetaceae bacterium]|nr:hypothetical protein [Planctomycetaceae bacterium]